MSILEADNDTVIVTTSDAPVLIIETATALEVRESETIILEQNVAPPAIVTTGPPVPFEVVTQGPQGIPGPPGDGSFLHNQPTPAATWTITHNLGYRPAVSTFDSAGDGIFGEVVHLSSNALEVRFASAQGGTANLS